jgi:hypothetical protein
VRWQESKLLPKLTSLVVQTMHIYTALLTNDLDCLLDAIPLYDTMYMKEDLQQNDHAEFLKAMVKKIEDYNGRGHWRIMTKDEMRKNNYTYRPIMAVWLFERKRNPQCEITKYKARLCCHGGQTVKGVHCEDIFLPVVAWSTVRLMLTLSIVNGWHARQIDFVLAFPQAKVKTDIYMQVPDKFEVKKKDLVLHESASPPHKQDAVLKLIQNVYDLTPA